MKREFKQAITIALLFQILLFPIMIRAMEPGTGRGGGLKRILLSGKTCFTGKEKFVEIPANFGETAFTSTGVIIISPIITLAAPFLSQTKHIGNRSFIGNSNPEFSYQSENCRLKLDEKKVTLNEKHYFSKKKIYSLKVNKDFSLLINGKKATPTDEQ